MRQAKLDREGEAPVEPDSPPGQDVILDAML